MSHVITILAEGFEETEAVTFIDILRRADIKVTILGLHSLKVRGAHDITIEAESIVSSGIDLFDGIILPGGQPGTVNLAESDVVLSLIKKAHSQKLLCAAICAAPIVLYKAGILKGVKVSCYPGTEKQLQNAQVTDSAVSIDGNIITSRGLGTAIDFSLSIVSYLMDQQTAKTIKSIIVAD